MKTTNYYNTFIEVAEDCPVDQAKIPPLHGDKKTVARMKPWNILKPCGRLAGEHNKL